MKPEKTSEEGPLSASEISALLTTIHEAYGYDFSHYARASLQRRLFSFLNRQRIQTFREVQEQIVHDRRFFQRFLNELTVSTTELFRDPAFFTAFRETVLPYLRTFPGFKIWHAGCSTGEEVFSMAILLHEVGLLDRGLLYGTDVNTRVIEEAKKGIVPVRTVRDGTSRYFESGGSNAFHEAWLINHGFASLNARFMKRLVFAEHNLVTDGAFGEMQVICCRNVIIYFDRELRDRILLLFRSCLSERGYLCLGSKETLLGSAVAKDFEEVDRRNKIYRKKFLSEGRA